MQGFMKSDRRWVPICGDCTIKTYISGETLMNPTDAYFSHQTIIQNSTGGWHHLTSLGRRKRCLWHTERITWYISHTNVLRAWRNHRGIKRMSGRAHELSWCERRSCRRLVKMEANVGGPGRCSCFYIYNFKWTENKVNLNLKGLCRLYNWSKKKNLIKNHDCISQSIHRKTCRL